MNDVLEEYYLRIAIVDGFQCDKGEANGLEESCVGFRTQSGW